MVTKQKQLEFEYYNFNEDSPRFFQKHTDNPVFNYSQTRPEIFLPTFKTATCLPDALINSRACASEPTVIRSLIRSAELISLADATFSPSLPGIPLVQNRYAIQNVIGSEIATELIFSCWPSKFKVVDIKATPHGKKYIGRMDDNFNNIAVDASDYYFFFSGRKDDQHIYHLLYEAIPRLWAMQQMETNHSSLILIFTYQPTKLQVDVIRRLGIKNKIAVLASNEKYFFNKIKIATHPDPPTCSLSYLLWLKEILMPQVRKLGLGEYVYLNRADSHNQREFTGSKLIEEYLIRIGFVSITLGKVDFITQLGIISNAKMIIFEHGGAGATLFAASDDCIVVELMPNRKNFINSGLPPHYYSLAVTLGLNYFAIEDKYSKAENMEALKFIIQTRRFISNVNMAVNN